LAIISRGFRIEPAEETNMGKHLVRGVLAGVAGGLVASWMMNEFATTLGQKISDAVETPADKRELAAESDGQDATMRAADKIVETVTGGRHLTYEQREIGGPIVHYAMGAVTGGVYGALAEYLPIVRTGLGTGFGGFIFSTADVFGVPALGLDRPSDQYPLSSWANPLASHLVYGVTTELVRRVVRKVL
jgi:putative membrane protein